MGYFRSESANGFWRVILGGSRLLGVGGASEVPLVEVQGLSLNEA